MSFEELFGRIAVVAFMFAVGCLVAYSRLPPTIKLIIYAGLALRFVGSWIRYTLLVEVYRTGDARAYYDRGLLYAEYFSRLDLSPFLDTTLWMKGKWHGTQFVNWPAGIVHTLIGPSMLGGFIAFSLLAFLGIVGFAMAFRRSFPQVPVTRYLAYIFLFPSLWYWPSSIGKEAIMLMGIGLAVAGFVGRDERINWPLLCLGLYFVFAIRPQVAAVIILSIILGHWLSLGGRWTVGKAVQGLLIMGLGLAGIWFSMKHVGIDGFDAEGVQSYMEDSKGRTVGGGSAVDQVDVGLAGIPVALMNILMRPFPWEARNPMMLVSAVEILLFWALVWYRRQNFVNALRNWRAERFLRMAIPFILVYSITLGMVVANLGIIARQRVFLFPFLFLLLEAMPARKEERIRAQRPLPRPTPPARQVRLVQEAVT